MLSVRSSVDSIYSRLSGEKPLPKPAYHCNMNPEEQSLWALIVSAPLIFVLIQRHTNDCTGRRKVRIHTRQEGQGTQASSYLRPTRTEATSVL